MTKNKTFNKSEQGTILDSYCYITLYINLMYISELSMEIYKVRMQPGFFKD